MAKCDQTQPKLCVLAASEPPKLVVTACFAPSEHGEKELNSSCINELPWKELKSSGNIERKILVIL